MKVLAFLTAVNIAFFPAQSPELAALTVLVLAVVWLAWPAARLIERLIG